MHVTPLGLHREVEQAAFSTVPFFFFFGHGKSHTASSKLLYCSFYMHCVLSIYIGVRKRCSLSLDSREGKGGMTKLILNENFGLKEGNAIIIKKETHYCSRNVCVLFFFNLPFQTHSPGTRGSPRKKGNAGGLLFI